MTLKLSSPLSTSCILQPCLYQPVAAYPAAAADGRQMEDTRKAGENMTPQHQTSPVPAFNSTAELWKDYLLRFETFVNDNSVPDEKKALVFLSNMTSGTYKLITNYASQQDVPTTVNVMQFSDITDFM